MTEKPLEYGICYILEPVLVLKYLSFQQMSKFPDFSGFWEFPKDSKVIPVHVQNSQELGKFPGSSHTGFLQPWVEQSSDVYFEMNVMKTGPAVNPL